MFAARQAPCSSLRLPYQSLLLDENRQIDGSGRGAHQSGGHLSQVRMCDCTDEVAVVVQRGINAAPRVAVLINRSRRMPRWSTSSKEPAAASTASSPAWRSDVKGQINLDKILLLTRKGFQLGEPW